MVFFLPEESCPAKLASQFYGYVKESRNAQQYPLLLMDYYQDLLMVDGVISDHPRYLELLPGGQAATYADGKKRLLPAALPDLSLEHPPLYLFPPAMRQQRVLCPWGRRTRCLFQLILRRSAMPQLQSAETFCQVLSRATYSSAGIGVPFVSQRTMEAKLRR